MVSLNGRVVKVYRMGLRALLMGRMKITTQELMVPIWEERKWIFCNHILLGRHAHRAYIQSRMVENVPN
jgi:hypothetical protein